MLLLLFSKHCIVESSRLDKAYFSHVADDTTGPYLSKQEYESEGCMTAARNLPATSNTRHQHCVLTRSKNYNYTKTDAQTIIFTQTRSHRFVQKADSHSKYHSNGRVNSQVCVRTEPDTQQRGATRGAVAPYIQSSHRFREAVAMQIHAAERRVHGPL